MKKLKINCMSFYWSCEQRYVLSACLYIFFNFHLFFLKQTNPKKFERLGYNRIKKIFYSSSTRKTLISLESRPYFITGFLDGEASFTASISKSSKVVVGWTVIPCFKVTLHKKDRAVLEMI